MANVTLFTPDELSALMSRIDGDADFKGFSGFEIILLISHLKQTGQLEFLSDWYKDMFDQMKKDQLLDENGNILVSIHSVYVETAALGLFQRPDKFDQ